MKEEYRIIGFVKFVEICNPEMSLACTKRGSIDTGDVVLCSRPNCHLWRELGMSNKEQFYKKLEIRFNCECCEWSGPSAPWNTDIRCPKCGAEAYPSRQGGQNV